MLSLGEQSEPGEGGVWGTSGPGGGECLGEVGAWERLVSGGVWGRSGSSTVIVIRLGPAAGRRRV
jgi:hypothetical protein